MAGLRWSVSPGALVLLALLVFFDESCLTISLGAAVLVHELGHGLALLACGARLRRLSVSAFGLRLDYAGPLSTGQTLLSLGAGPLAGAVYGLLAPGAGGAFGSLSGRLSLALTAFNLLPALPLDGGRIAALLLGEQRAQTLSRLLSPLLLLGGAGLLFFCHSPALLAAGAWLTLYNYRKSATKD